MESLASNENKRTSIAVIFSGSGTDGIKGTEAIKQAGGLVIVQSPESCEFPELPRRIIQNGNASYVVLPQDMPMIIQGYINRRLVKQPGR